MKVLLRIDASARHAGSHSRDLAQHFESQWLAQYPGARVISRDLAKSPLPHLSAETIEAFLGLHSRGTATSDELINELIQADHLLINTPIYNFGAPSSLKAYLDQVVRFGKTFTKNEEGYRGLLEGKTATILLTCGGPTRAGNDFLSDGLKRVLRFIGIQDIDLIALEGTALDAREVEARSRTARREIDLLFGIADPAIWAGDFSQDDQQQINRLRDGQRKAILKSDAAQYAELCADDVQLMVPGHPPVRGKAALHETEEKLFRSTRFESFRKRPIRIERGGELAVETGMQFVESANPLIQQGIAAERQKYTHIYRRTDRGWRFAVLMSNDCGNGHHG
jgi:FMN-dependent NADH-azoreductase